MSFGMLTRLRFPALVFFGTSFVGLLLLYRVFNWGGWRMSTVAMVYGLVLGLVVQSLFLEPLPRWRVATAAFFGSFVLWLPVVVVSYGFALLATPVLVAYAAAVVVGTVAAARMQRGLN